MDAFFNPSSIAVFGVAEDPRNLAQNIVLHCRKMGFRGGIYPVGRRAGTVHGEKIITDPETLPRGIDLAVILVPARVVADTLDICGRKGILHAVISTGGFREFEAVHNQAETRLISVAERYGIRFIGPNCIGIINPGSGLCTPFNPLRPDRFKKGPIGLIIQSGGVTTQSAYHFSDEHVGFSKIISVGNKLNLDETDFIRYLRTDPETEQIHLYLESIENGREFMRGVKETPKPMVIFKSNTTDISAEIAHSHTAALANNDRIVSGAFRQWGVVRAKSIHDMTVAAKALRLPPLKGNRLAVISLSGGFSVILGDACQKNGFTCPPLPRSLMDRIEGFRRGRVIRMSNPMDFGDIHDIDPLVFTLEQCLSLQDIDGVVLSFIYDPQMSRMIGGETGGPEEILRFMRKLCRVYHKPVALSLLTERRFIEKFKALEIFPLFNDPEESVRALALSREHYRKNPPAP